MGTLQLKKKIQVKKKQKKTVRFRNLARGTHNFIK